MNSGVLDQRAWQLIERLLPPAPRRTQGGRPRLPDRSALEGILYVLHTGTPWELLSVALGFGSGMTCLRRLREWQRLGVWDGIRECIEVALPELRLEWSRAAGTGVRPVR